MAEMGKASIKTGSTVPKMTGRTEKPYFDPLDSH